MLNANRFILIIIFTFYTTLLAIACLNQGSIFHPDFYFQTIWFLFLILQTELYLINSLSVRAVSLLALKLKQLILKILNIYKLNNFLRTNSFIFRVNLKEKP
jgi:hypothetical protein